MTRPGDVAAIWTDVDLLVDEDPLDAGAGDRFCPTSWGVVAVVFAGSAVIVGLVELGRHLGDVLVDWISGARSS